MFCLVSILTRRGCCSLTHEGQKEVVEEGVNREREGESPLYMWSESLCLSGSGKKKQPEPEKRQFELSEFTVWRDTFLLMEIYSKCMNVKLLDVFTNDASFMFSLHLSLYSFWEKRLFSPLLSLFIIFALQMVRAVHAKDCGRRLDAARFSHCCHRHLR